MSTFAPWAVSPEESPGQSGWSARHRIPAIVGSLLLVAVTMLLGERNWYLPRWLSWLPKPPGPAGLEGAEAAPEPSPAAPDTGLVPAGPGR